MEDVYDVERNMGTPLNFANSGTAEGQGLATFGTVAQGSFSTLPPFGCIDATDPGFRGLCPKVEYNDDSRTPEGFAIKELGEMLVK